MIPDSIPADHPAVEAACDAYMNKGDLVPVDEDRMSAALTAALPFLAPSDKTLLAKALGEMSIAYSRAIEALWQYGTHDSDCPVWNVPSQVPPSCTCGFDAALRDLGAEDE